LEPLTDHETHVGIHTYAVAINANAKGHLFTTSLGFRESAPQLIKVDTVVFVDVKSLDDHGNLAGREHIADHFFDSVVKFGTVDGTVTVCIKVFKQGLNRHVFLVQGP
jgi:hypothetical protein